jgi:hypothetical protein
MTQRKDRHGSQQNTIYGAGNIVTDGEIIDSRLIAHAQNSPVQNSPVQNSTVQDLREQLARAHESLAAVPDPTAAQHDALDAVDLLQGEIDEDPDPAPDRLKRLRLQLRGLIAVLAPVAEVIGGVAAFEEILRHL